MIRPIVRDVFFLSQKSEEASKADLPIGRDLRDTLRANADRCVGMAANMIGVKKRIMIVSIGGTDLVMFNPVITRKSDPYEAEEGCLSLDGRRKTTRYRNIALEYTDERWTRQKLRLSGWAAQICQHEIDHMNGVII